MKTVPDWVVFHVPHDSTDIPAEVRSQYLLDDGQLLHEIVLMTDHLTSELFTQRVPDNQVVRAPVSRLVVDCERFENDADEPMAGRGMGVVYQRTSDGSPLRRPISECERRALLDDWYWPHHSRLTNAVQRTLDHHGHALLIDAHSFPSKALRYEQDQRDDRPEICIGTTDPYHTPKSLEDAFVCAFRDRGFDTRLNQPFSGVLVPARHYRSDPRVRAVMVEVNRALYLDEATARKRHGFQSFAEELRECIREAIGTWNEVR
jgi:N-formylglutamate amidohydrolase